MSVPDWLPAFVEERIAADRAAAPENGDWLDEQNGMVLYGTIGHHAVLRRDGSVWLYEADDFGNSDDYSWRIVFGREREEALSVGTRRYPELLELLPDRDPGAVDCPMCKGEGRLEQDVVCPQCGSLGWISSDAT